MLQPILNTSLVEEALRLMQPAIQHTLDRNLMKRSDLAIVVTATTAIVPWKPKQHFSDRWHVLRKLGNPSQWESNFDEIALSKAEQSVRSRRDTATLPPHYHEVGDTTFWGSVVLDDIVVACSGVEPYFDEMFAMWVASAVKATAKHHYTARVSDNRIV